MKTKTVNTNELDFDKNNPRLVIHPDLSNASDEEVIRELAIQSDLSELIQSISANTYLDIEPLIVIKEGERYRVLEGNRRLAAIRVINDPELAKRCKLSLPEITNEVKKSLKLVSVYPVNKEEEARAFIGFKHVNGAHRWDSYAKAKYCKQWYQKGKENGLAINDIARKLGDENYTIKSLICGMLVLEQAEREGLFDLSDRNARGRFPFSHLYTALGRKEYLDFLGLEPTWNNKPDLNPIKKENFEKLKEVLIYFFGSKSEGFVPIIKSQNPDLKHVGEVLAHPKALSILRIERDLKLAYEEVLPPSAVFSDALVKASNAVTNALKKAGKFLGSEKELLVITEELVSSAESLLAAMKFKEKKYLADNREEKK